MIEGNYFWINIFFLALGTLAIRGSVIAISSRVTIPERLKEIFTFIPAAILPALIAQAVYFHKGKIDWVFGKERLIILFLAAVVCYFTRSIMATIISGLALLYIVT